MKQMITLLLFLITTSFPLTAQSSTGDPQEDSLILAEATRPVYAMYDIQKPPKFPGGEKELIIFLRDNFKYTYLHSPGKEYTTILVNFVVETDGSLTNLHLSKGEAFFLPAVQEVFADMPLWEPGELHAEKVAVLFTVPIRVEY